jgi:3-deoxy-7-phosphoheptulonate synthase
MKHRTDDLRISEIKELMSPAQVHEESPITTQTSETVFQTRSGIQKILREEDDRLVVVIGPCSVHDPKAALEYASKLAPLQQALKDDLLIIMRVYFEKPRTTVGWKGLINDPTLDDRFEINEGIRQARKLLLDINNLGLPAGTEYLDLISPQYIADLISWGAIGARTTESQCHRELASGLSCPVGFKNATDGNTKIAVDAIGSASNPHHFLSVTKEGRSAIFSTSGNSDCHVILRGGDRPNYDSESISLAAEEIIANGLPARLMVDFSHANSRKKYERQLVVGHDVASQISRGDKRIFGAMIESNLVAGQQKVVAGQPLTHGQSITDACISWEQSEPLLHELAEAVRSRRKCS